jgi:small subunit ribosomal protein S12
MTKIQNAKNRHTSNKNHCWGRMLDKNPQKRGVVQKVRIQTPRKPNSARRQVVKLYLTTKRYTVSYIPGSGHTLKKHSTVIISAGGARDLPGVYSSCIRGLKDLKGIMHKKRRRSIYGVSKKLQQSLGLY